MSATEEKSLSSRVRKLAVIAGGGEMPGRLLYACDGAGIEAFVVAFEGQTDPAVLTARSHMLTRLGAAGQIIDTLKNHGIKDIVLIGSIRRPSLTELKPDMRTAQFFAKLGLKALGDDGLLRALKQELAAEGFTVHAVQDFVKDLLMPEGAIGRYKPKKGDQVDIDRGIEVSQELGRFDVGQSVVVQEGLVLGLEAIEGTDSLIRRCKGYKRGGRGGVLVKTCKPQQDRALDLPTIGPDTVRLCAEAELAGIVVQAGAALLLDRQAVAEMADKNKMFVVGVHL